MPYELVCNDMVSRTPNDTLTMTTPSYNMLTRKSPKQLRRRMRRFFSRTFPSLTWMRRRPNCMLIRASKAADWLDLLPALERISERFPTLNLFLIDPSDPPSCTLQRFRVMPAMAPGLTRLSFIRANVRLVLVAGELDGQTNRLIRVAKERGNPIIFVKASPEGEAARAEILAQEVDAILASWRSRAITLCGHRGLSNWLNTLFESRLFARRKPRIDSIESIREALGMPRSILCLGNGPSSEDPRLKHEAHDSLFRVNYRWHSRSFLTNPQVIFTTLDASIAALGTNKIYICPTRRATRHLRLKSLLRFRRLTIASLEQLGVLDQRDFEISSPTNGVSMVKLAVALQPQRLIVAGMDFFSHPDGAYPGLPQAPNAYDIAHDRAQEKRMLLSTLESYKGELAIVGEALFQLWTDNRASPRPPSSNKQEHGP